MTIRKCLIPGMALAAAFLAGSMAQAIPVQYVTIGNFTYIDEDGFEVTSSTYERDGVVISFENELDGFANPDFDAPSNVTFGSFDTAGTTASSFQDVDAVFDLQIIQVDPAELEPLNFVGSLSGQLRFDNSQAFVQFGQPLTQQLGLFIYSIVSADDGNLGRVNLAVPSAERTETSIAGRIAVIPEPSTVVLAALALPGIGALAYRNRRRRVTVEA